MSNPEASSVVFDREGWFFFFPLFGKPAVCFLTLFQIGKKLAVTFVVSLFNVYCACKWSHSRYPYSIIYPLYMRYRILTLWRF